MHSFIMPCWFPRKKTQKSLKSTRRTEGIKGEPAESIDLPDDVIAHILCLLPVKSLLRFKYISKLWCSMIGSKYFIQLHLRKSIDNNTKLSLILQGKKLYSVTCNSHESPACIDTPFGCNTMILGSCNGLLCIRESDHRSLHKQARKYDISLKIALWNPSIKKVRILPVVPIEVDKQDLIASYGNHFIDVFYAFGYDSMNDDYKVLRIVLPGVVNFIVEAKVYSLTANSWRAIDVPSYVQHSFQPVLSLRYSHYALVQEAFHWLMICEKEFIVTFDIQRERFCTLPLPNLDLQHIPRKLSVLRQCLCLVDFVYGIDRFEIWVMKEYGMKDSWVKLFSFTGSVYTHLMPFAQDDDDKVLLLQISTILKFRWYDLKRDQMSEDVTISSVAKIDSAYTFDRSLVSPLNHSSQTTCMKHPRSEKDRNKQKSGRAEIA